MYRPLVDLLEDSIACAEVQLEAARSLDTEQLSLATARRQDLLFEMEAEGAPRLLAEMDDEAQALAFELRALDARLERILQSGIRVFQGLNTGGDAPPVYSSNGRIRGGRT